MTALTPLGSRTRPQRRTASALLALVCATGGAIGLAIGGAMLSPAQASTPATAKAAAAAPTAQPAAAPGQCPSLLRHSFARLQDNQTQSLCQFSGKVLLVVNTASYCGFTSQFEGLEALNARYAARGLTVLGFPSNDFKQEDADARKTAAVCFNTYGVKFQMFSETRVRGSSAHPLFAELARATGEPPSWNFNKYLVGRDGRVLAHFGSMTAPESRKLVSAIEAALASR